MFAQKKAEFKKTYLASGKSLHVEFIEGFIGEGKSEHIIGEDRSGFDSELDLFYRAPLLDNPDGWKTLPEEYYIIFFVLGSYMAIVKGLQQDDPLIVWDRSWVSHSFFAQVPSKLDCEEKQRVENAAQIEYYINLIAILSNNKYDIKIIVFKMTSEQDIWPFRKANELETDPTTQAEYSSVYGRDIESIIYPTIEKLKETRALCYKYIDKFIHQD
jgi:hypothetical protein